MLTKTIIIAPCNVILRARCERVNYCRCARSRLWPSGKTISLLVAAVRGCCKELAATRIHCLGGGAVVGAVRV